MTGPLDEPEHATPLTTEERQGLIPSHVTLRSELNELEQQNILEAVTWAFSRKHDPVKEAFGRGLHRRMFDKVWRWAGTYRTSNKNLGVEFWQVNPRLKEVMDNVAFWIEHKSYPPDEIAVRFHHALVFIHPFPNGNGRWSRLMADILILRLGGQQFTWGRSALRDADETRKIYIAALKKADNHDYNDLLVFARS
ncbi:MAG: mobile mystery protein B [Candidatus Sungbacteria bacterium]|uniref:Mobile mystery protein B n=1 Tax=Candidatus Sungiibacteriota bacterium TaxID=2750080 RepID=A0A932VSD3_9BACT|nr:mobile mystery protein B [Candidatus Sungbacteria bacterium]